MARPTNKNFYPNGGKDKSSEEVQLIRKALDKKDE
jgi:hypothetical protein